ncbi:MAG TPA: hypothetical protein VM221_13330 [Armatimonadota bacterium]|nr:hypothetical protein [Armatimonadota bacterium]
MAPHNRPSGIRTSLRQHLHSLPPSHRSPHLERHLLAKEKERLEQEIVRLERRCRQCRQQAADIEAQLATATEGASTRSSMLSPTGGNECDERPFSRMAVDY